VRLQNRREGGADKLTIEKPEGRPMMKLYKMHSRHAGEKKDGERNEVKAETPPGTISIPGEKRDTKWG